MMIVRPDAAMVAMVAVGIDLLFGDPAWLDRTVGHPTRWLGAAIDQADHRMNQDGSPAHRRRAAGVLALLLLSAPPVLLSSGLDRALRRVLPRSGAIAVSGLLSSTLLAQRSLRDHVAAVGAALARGGLPAGRAAVSRIVGRDTATLDESAVLGAAIESLAENFSDGIVAPLFWGIVFGLPGMVFYKSVNTADSMIGHLSPRHAEFGRAAARLDDLVNLPASRLSALLLTLSAPPRAWHRIWRVVLRDAPQHRSPNAGWPEAAMAASLRIRLGGMRCYGGHAVAVVPIGDGRDRIEPVDLRRALALFHRACFLQAGLLGAVVLLRRAGKRR